MMMVLVVPTDAIWTVYGRKPTICKISNNTSSGVSLKNADMHTWKQFAHLADALFRRCRICATAGKKSSDNPKGQTAVVQKVDVTNWMQWWEIKETWTEKHELQGCGCRIYFCQEVFCPPTRAGGRRYTAGLCTRVCQHWRKTMCM